jgi:hypothetical protein
MDRFSAIIAAAVTLLAGVSAQASPQPRNDGKVCREAPRTVGSHIRSGKRCRTAADWNEVDRKAAEQRLPQSFEVKTPAAEPGRDRPG